MMLIAVVIYVLFVGSNAKSLERAYERPPWVLWGEQPQNELYQIRKYNTSLWAVTNVTAFSENEAAEIGFGRIHQYISGHNKREIIIPMTVPVTVDVFESPCIFCPRRFTVSFYIPLAHQSDTPEPADEKIIIVTRPAFVVYARWFGSPSKPVSYTREAYNLYNRLNQDNITSVATNHMALATYDQPFKTFLRENEVWLDYWEEEEEQDIYIEDYEEEDNELEEFDLEEEDEEQQ